MVRWRDSEVHGPIRIPYLTDSIFLIEYLKSFDVREDMENGKKFYRLFYDIDP